MELVGRICKIFQPRDGMSQRTGEMWVSQDFMIEYFYWPNQTTPSRMVLSIFGAERIQEADLKEGEEVKIRYHVDAREYNGRWYNDVRFDGIEHIHRVKEEQTQEKPVGAEKNQERANTQSQAEKPADGEKSDDLPF